MCLICRFISCCGDTPQRRRELIEMETLVSPVPMMRTQSLFKAALNNFGFQCVALSARTTCCAGLTPCAVLCEHYLPWCGADKYEAPRHSPGTPCNPCRVHLCGCLVCPFFRLPMLSSTQCLDCPVSRMCTCPLCTWSPLALRTTRVCKVCACIDSTYHWFASPRAHICRAPQTTHFGNGGLVLSVTFAYTHQTRVCQLAL
jgi:hypothetical protein